MEPWPAVFSLGDVVRDEFWFMSPSRSLHEMRNEMVVLGIRSPSLELNIFDNLAVDSLLDCVRLIVLTG